MSDLSVFTLPFFWTLLMLYLLATLEDAEEYLWGKDDGSDETPES